MVNTWWLHDGPSAGFFDGDGDGDGLPTGYIPLAGDGQGSGEARWLTPAELDEYLADAKRLVQIAGHYAIGFAGWVARFEADRSREPGCRFFQLIDNERAQGHLRPDI